MTELNAMSELTAALSARVQERTIPLRVPKTEVFVRYRAFEQPELKRIRDRFLKGKANPTDAQVEKAGLLANPVILAETCEGIYLRTADGALTSADPDGEAPTFGARLLELLGQPAQETTSDIVRLLYGNNDFDIAAAVAKVSEFSGGAEAEVYEEAAGN